MLTKSFIIKPHFRQANIDILCLPNFRVKQLQQHIEKIAISAITKENGNKTRDIDAKNIKRKKKIRGQNSGKNTISKK